MQAVAKRCGHHLWYVPRLAQRTYHDHSLLISSVTNVALNTILFVSKIIKKTPAIIPRLAFTCLSFSGMISLNMQIRDWAKHVRDVRFALRFRSYSALLLTAARVCIKGTNILQTCSVFAGALIALAGMPHITFILFQVLRPISLCTLAGAIAGEFIDYALKKRLLKKMHKIHQLKEADEKIQLIAQKFIHLAYQSPYRKMDSRIRRDPLHKQEQHMAVDIIRQMEEWSLESFKKGLAAQSIGKNSILTAAQALHVYKGIEMAIKQNQTMTKANIGLRALGYVSLGICRAFPQTLVQYGLTLTMSLFYTSKLIVENYLLKQLRKYLARK
jgi:hypothetical protein